MASAVEAPVNRLLLAAVVDSQLPVVEPGSCFIVVKGVRPSLELLSSSSMVLETTFEQVSSCFEAAAAAVE